MQCSTEKIDSFSEEFAFLSNFYVTNVDYDGRVWKSSEHAYMAAKTLDPAWKDEIFNAPTAGAAKKLGRMVELRPDWEDAKLNIMEDILRIKFADPVLDSWLFLTKHYKLEEGNWWGDTFWGICNGKGENHLGKILMKIRDE